MTGASIKIEDAALLAMLDNAAAAGRDLTGLLDELGAQVELATQRSFETEQDPDGNPWPKSLRALAKGGQTLTLTARLRQSITRRVSAHAVEVGTPVVYAAIHQFGGEVKHEAGTVTLYRHYDAKSDTFDPRFRRKSKSNFATEHVRGAYTVTMPKRPFLGVGPRLSSILREVTRDWLRRNTGGVARA
ncbi:MAG TPA: phage virion morphogenesis protein [Azospirillum sp.]|nr:phage virion morphogenesis protein [Azospirillum sp.]